MDEYKYMVVSLDATDDGLEEGLHNVEFFKEGREAEELYNEMKPRYLDKIF